MSNIFIKDPSARTDYQIDWEDWLGGDTISGTPSWTVPSGITQYQVSNTTTATTIWLSAGTAGQDYDVVCQITTAGNRINQQTIKILVREK